MTTQSNTLSPEVIKQQSKRAKKILEELGHTLPLAHCRELVSRLDGARNWHQITQGEGGQASSTTAPKIEKKPIEFLVDLSKLVERTEAMAILCSEFARWPSMFDLYNNFIAKTDANKLEEHGEDTYSFVHDFNGASVMSRHNATMVIRSIINNLSVEEFVKLYNTALATNSLVPSKLPRISHFMGNLFSIKTIDEKQAFSQAFKNLVDRHGTKAPGIALEMLGFESDTIHIEALGYPFKYGDVESEADIWATISSMTYSVSPDIKETFLSKNLGTNVAILYDYRVSFEDPYFESEMQIIAALK